MIQLRRAVYEDIPRIMEFIDTYWKKGHILAKDRRLFEWQHVRDKEVFYILAEDDVTHEIYGSMGYMPLAYDTDRPCISTTMIRCLNNPEHRLLSQDMDQCLIRNDLCSNQISPGVEKKYARTILLQGDYIRKLEQYYILNPASEYRISQIQHYEYAEPLYDDALLVPFDSAQELWQVEDPSARRASLPYRDRSYIEHRYYDHPYYHYQIYGIERDHTVRSILIGREESVLGHTIFRIVDYLGDDEDLAHIGHELQCLMEIHKYEYIDFYCYGIDSEILAGAGFIHRSEDDANILPNYFDPYLCRNVEIYFYAWFTDDHHVYRGMGDQDRPNSVPKSYTEN